MLILYTEEQLGAAFQIYSRVHAARDMDSMPFEEFRDMFEYQYYARSNPDEIFNGDGATTH
jgi:hypothetical protein